MATLQKTDISQHDDSWQCTKVSDIEHYVSAGYWAWKTFGWLAGIP